MLGSLKHKAKMAVQPDYRKRHTEIMKLYGLARHTRAATDLLGPEIQLLDAASFLVMNEEIFEKQIYRFPADTETPCILDGGANIGLSAIYFKQLYPKSQVIAFEPDPEVFAVLSGNLRAFGFDDVELVKKALWSSETTLSFMQEGADAGRVGNLLPEHNVVKVETVRLRDYLDRPVDLLKLDIEGAETEVVLDCADRLANVKNLFIEYHSFTDKPQTLAPLLEAVTQSGFRLYIHPIAASPQPFCRRSENYGMDMQLNIFGYRPKA